ncbi:hypothetical protein JTE90_027592 [Oedothorax gibbosus]|uniref:C2H2-type domain-containing protein n=1 Tax=Oedothorax gibbosus TaxID=931172 RepID=A0AAV6VLF8_9ARAC|nr:hypothetical protein JTE90_027592 [Oedothorax gibbosus]
MVAQRIYKCSVCSREFNYKHCLRRHEQVHKEVRQVHTCEICGAHLKRKDTLKEHMMLKHNVMLEVIILKGNHPDITHVTIVANNFLGGTTFCVIEDGTTLFKLSMLVNFVPVHLPERIA